ncbi:hypothetical protein M1B72_10990 [Geomonas paludis]|uniref:Lipoprotein n=1 Tax=Geomonas paludis TaxID=2740185 RepID=A0A6V8MT47_9BACT|nr:hypothetical protein [Geomonas paludis]UPU38208.1 hypothetical protein M1B72_10990 [Geomonas paludis]GFO63260.1 hypothetical protein GMPD_11790 [Geomonas paludis]
MSVETWKRLAAVLFLLAASLPIARCSEESASSSTAQSSQATAPAPAPAPAASPGVKEAETPQPEPGSELHQPGSGKRQWPREIRVFALMERDDPQTWLPAACFLWPVPLVVLRLWRDRRGRVLSGILELCGCCLTAWFLGSLAFSDWWRLCIGWYLGGAALLMHLTATVAGFFRRSAPVH